MSEAHHINPATLLVATLLVATLGGCTQLEERTSLQGQVCLRACATDSVLSGVEVELQLAAEPNAPDRPVTVTDSTGEFLFFNISSVARYRLVVKSEAYTCPPREELIDPAQDNLQEIDILCDLSTQLGGPGSDACGQELPNVEVVATDLHGANLTGTNFANADLSYSDLSQATLTGANLTNARLIQTTLTGANLAGRATGCEPTADGQPTRLIGAQLSGADLSSADLTGADFSNADLNGANLQGSDPTDADFTGANLRGTRPDALRGCPAQLPEPWRCVALPGDAPQRHAFIGPEVVLTGASMPGLRLDGASLPGADLSDTDLTHVSLVGADLTDANLQGATLTGLRAHGLRGCPAQLPPRWSCVSQPGLGADPDDSPLTFPDRFALVGPGAQLQQADLSGARLTGADLTDADLTDADLRESDLTGAILRGATLRGTRPHRLLGCPEPDWSLDWRCVQDAEERVFALVGPEVDLSRADMSSAQLQNANLRGANLQGASFTGADLSGADVSGANLQGAGLYSSDPTGADFSNTQLQGGLRGANMGGCPTQLPDPWRCVAQPNDRFALIGPEASLSGLVNLSGADLRDTVLVRATMQSADLSRADLTGADLTDARFGTTDVSGATLHGLRGCPQSGDLREGGGPFAYPTDDEERLNCLNTLNDLFDQAEELSWSCVLQPETGRFAFVGPGVELRGANLAGVHFDATTLAVGANLTDADLTGASITPTQVQCARWDNTVCPDGVNSDDTETGTCDDHMTQ